MTRKYHMPTLILLLWLIAAMANFYAALTTGNEFNATLAFGFALGVVALR